MDSGEQPTARTPIGVNGLGGPLAVAGIALFVLLVGSLAASAELGDRPRETPDRVAWQVQSEGGLAFERQCAGCHGTDGGGGVAPDLRRWTGSVDETAAIISEGAPGMPAFSPTLTEAQIRALAEHLDELVGVSTYERECAGCHGAAGEGGIAPSLKLTRQGEDERRGVITEGAGSMPGFALELTESEIEALVWRTEGYADVGSAIYTGQCAPCHGALGEGVTGPPLAGESVSPAEAVAIVSAGFGGMPAFGTSLEPGDIEAVVQFAISLEEGTTTGESTTTTITEAVSAVEIYSEFCASCHGVDAEGGIGPSLVGLDITDGELQGVIMTGQGSMPGFDDVLDDARVEALVGFVRSLAQPSDAEVTEAGADLYAQQCAACHGADGRGGLGPSLRTTLLTGRGLRAAIVEGNATMPAFGRTLDESAIELAVEFVEWLKQADVPGVPLRGGSVIYRQDCSACHGESGEGGIGPVLQNTELTVNEIVAQVYGGHTEGMPAFAGALDGQQVRDVAHFIKTFETAGDRSEGVGFMWWLLIGAAVVVASVAAWLGFVRLRRRPATS